MVTRDFCQKVKCGIIPQSDAGMDNVFECAQLYDPGVLASNDIACGRPSQPTALTTLTPQNLVSPMPDIAVVPVGPGPSSPGCTIDGVRFGNGQFGSFAPLTQSTNGFLDALNQFISDSPVCAGILLFGLAALAFSSAGRKR